MGFNFKKTKGSAVCQIVLGFLCVIFGIFDRIFVYMRYGTPEAFHTEGLIAIWTGVWFFVSGFMGNYASQPIPDSQGPKMAMVKAYLGFSIVSSVFAGVLLICYSVGINNDILRGNQSCSKQAMYRRKCIYYPYYSCSYVRVSLKEECQKSVGLGAMIIILAIAEFGVSIWASVCCCSAGTDGCCNDCCCDTSQPQQGQVVYLQTQGGPVAAYVMTQGPNVMPVAAPAMIGGPGYPVPNQAVGGQEYMIQNPQDATAMTPTQYVPEAGGHDHEQNRQGATSVTPTQYVQEAGGHAHEQNRQGATSVTPSQYVQEAGGHAHEQNRQGATSVTPSQEGVTTSSN